MRNLVEYAWDEKTQVGHFTYENDGKEETSTRLQPFCPPAPAVEAYWEELRWFLKSQAA